MLSICPMSLFIVSSQASRLKDCSLGVCSLNVFVRLYVFVFFFLLVRSCFLITLNKCLKGHKSLYVFVNVFVFLLVSSCLLITLISCLKCHKGNNFKNVRNLRSFCRKNNPQNKISSGFNTADMFSMYL